MAEVIVVEDVVSENCVRRLHLMSNAPIEMSLPAEATVEQTQEAGVYHLRAEWPFKGALSIEAEGWPQAKRMVAWSFDGCMNVTEALMHASVFYEHTFGRTPQYGFLRRLPSGVEEGRETGPLLVFSAEWMLEGAVVVGG